MKRIQVASKGKRVLAALIDLAIIAGLFAISYFFIFSKAVSAVQNFDYHNSVILNEKKGSYLYTPDGSKTKLIDNPNMPYGDIDTSVKEYYTKYLKGYYEKTGKKEEKYTEYWYGVYILRLKDEKGIFEGEPEYKTDEVLYEWKDTSTCDEYIPKTTATEEQLKTFQGGNFGTAVVDLANNDLTPLKKSQSVITYGTVRIVLYSSLLSTFIPCFIIPICLKNGKTIGKLVMKLVVLTDEGYEYKRYKHIFRYLSFYFIEVFGGVITIGLTFILTVSLVLFSKKHRALHDYISFSVVADEPHSVFFKDIEEENIYKDKSLKKLEI